MERLAIISCHLLACIVWFKLPSVPVPAAVQRFRASLSRPAQAELACAAGAAGAGAAGAAGPAGVLSGVDVTPPASFAHHWMQLSQLPMGLMWDDWLGRNHWAPGGATHTQLTMKKMAAQAAKRKQVQAWMSALALAIDQTWVLEQKLALTQALVAKAHYMLRAWLAKASCLVATAAVVVVGVAGTVAGGAAVGSVAAVAVDSVSASVAAGSMAAVAAAVVAAVVAAAAAAAVVAVVGYRYCYGGGGSPEAVATSLFYYFEPGLLLVGFDADCAVVRTAIGCSGFRASVALCAVAVGCGLPLCLGCGVGSHPAAFSSSPILVPYPPPPRYQLLLTHQEGRNFHRS